MSGNINPPPSGSDGRSNITAQTIIPHTAVIRITEWWRQTQILGRRTRGRRVIRGVFMFRRRDRAGWVWFFDGC
ncbi:MAG: hypothetical protein QW514_09560 [Thermoprotei archaeon]